MDRPLRSAAERRTGDLVGDVGDHLVRVHVRLRSAARLPHDEGKVVVELPRLDPRRSLRDGRSEVRVELAVLEVDERRSPLHDSERADHWTTEALAPDAEVLEAALRLRAPVTPLGDLDAAHGVGLDALAHGGEIA